MDSGASLTFIHPRVLNAVPQLLSELEKDITLKVLRAVNGSSLQVLGRTQVPFEIDNKPYMFKAFVVEGMTYDVILGTDFLSHFKAKINFEDNTLDLSEDKLTRAQITATPSVKQENINEVRVLNYVEVPPFCEIFLKSELQRKIQSETIGFIEPSRQLTMKYSMCGAAILASVSSDGTVPFRLMNPTPVKVKLYPGTTLGSFTVMNDHSIGSIITDEDVAFCRNLHNDSKPTETKVPVDLTNTDLTSDQKVRLQNLLNSYSDLFAKSHLELGRTDLLEHHIDTGDHKPIALRPYRTSDTQRKQIEQHITEMQQAGLIKPSTGAWSAPAILIAKPDGSTRFCVDYRRLNALTVKDIYPLPLISQSIDYMNNSRYFSTMDMLSGFYQVPLSEDSKQKSQFTTYYGTYSWEVMPMGLTNSPATFQRLMETVL